MNKFGQWLKKVSSTPQGGAVIALVIVFAIAGITLAFTHQSSGTGDTSTKLTPPSGTTAPTSSSSGAQAQSSSSPSASTNYQTPYPTPASQIVVNTPIPAPYVAPTPQCNAQLKVLEQSYLMTAVQGYDRDLQADMNAFVANHPGQGSGTPAYQQYLTQQIEAYTAILNTDIRLANEKIAPCIPIPADSYRVG
jgi:hypothetical protein